MDAWKNLKAWQKGTVVVVAIAVGLWVVGTLTKSPEQRAIEACVRSGRSSDSCESEVLRR